MPTPKEMSIRSPELHKDARGIHRAQAHRLRKVIDSTIRFAEPHFDPAAVKPPQGQVRINQQCLVKKGSAIIKISDDIGERVSSVTEGGCVVRCQLHSASGQPSSFGNLLLSIDDPERGLAHAKARRCDGICHRKIRITLYGLVKQPVRFTNSPPRPFVKISQSSEK